jgi:hypothetical protein
MADRPNFFELLELDPSVDDWTVIEKSIREKQSTWAKDRTNGSPARLQKAKQGMALLNEIREVMEDPLRRRREAEAARELRRKTHETKERELVDWIEILRGSGSCRPEQLEKILRQLEGVYSEREIRERLAAAGIHVDSGPKPPREGLDPVTAKNLRRNLEQLKMGSLYELFKLPPDSSPEALSAKAEEILKEVNRLGQTDSAATAHSQLAGIAKTIFKNAEGKKKYDAQRVFDVLDELADKIEAAGADSVLTAHELDILVRLAAQRGAPAEDAREVLEQRAAEKGWKIERARAAPDPSPSPAGPSAAGGSPFPGGSSSGAAGDDTEPPAPARLIVRPIPAGFRLSWEPVRAPGELRYRVVRKAGSVPWDEGDGEVVASTSAAQADDPSVPPGAPWYYAVFTLRAGLASTVPAHSGPHLLGTEDAAPAGPAASSRKTGGLPIRRLATAAALLLALGGTGAALFLGPLSSVMGGAAAVSPNPPQPAPGPAPGPGPGTATPGSSNPNPNPAVPPSSNPSTTTVASSGIAAGILPTLTSPDPAQNQNGLGGGSNTGMSGGGSPSGAVLGDSSRINQVPPPASTGFLPENPEVAVLALGDPLLATAVEGGLENALRGEGLNIVSGLAALDDFRQDRESRASLSRILASLRGEGIHAVVVARVERLADRELNYYGRRDVASTSNLRIEAYLVDGGRSLGSGWSEQIEYTAVNAASEGRGAAGLAASDLAAAIRDGWAARRGGS